MKLDSHITPVWEIVENIRFHLAKKHKRKVYDIEIAKELKITRECLAKNKFANQNIFLGYLTRWCVINNLDVRDFVKYNNSIILGRK